MGGSGGQELVNNLNRYVLEEHARDERAKKKQAGSRSRQAEPVVASPQTPERKDS